MKEIKLILKRNMSFSVTLLITDIIAIFSVLYINNGLTVDMIDSFVWLIVGFIVMIIYLIENILLYNKVKRMGDES